MRVALIAILMTVLAPLGVQAQQPYAGQQARDIKALAPDEIADLEAGRGMGFAKAAELNHYPGPAHILELRQPLALTPQQAAAVQAAFDRMSEAAKPLGAALLDRERALDRGFADGAMTEEALARETAEIAALQGRLRAVHLGAHLEMRRILTGAQIARYDALRGYDDSSAMPMEHHRHGG